MRIVKRKEFMELPKNTVFSYFEKPTKYRPEGFDGIYIKTSDITENSADFFYISLIAPLAYDDIGDYVQACHNMAKGLSHPIDVETVQREGMFDDSYLYAIYEPEDVKKMIAVLSECVEVIK